MPRRHLMLLSCLIFCQPLLAQAQRAELLDVYRSAVEHDAQLSAARHEYQALRERVPQAMAGLLPTLDAGISIEGSRLQTDETNGDRIRSGTLHQASLTQPLFRLDRWHALKAAEAGTAQAALQLAEKEQALILRVAEAYFDTLRTLDALAAAKAEEAALRRQQQQARERLVNGASSITDVLDAQAAHDVASANRKRLQRKVEDTFEVLHRLTRQKYTQIAGVTHQLTTRTPVPAQAETWVSLALQGNLSLLASEHARDAAEHTNRQRKAGHAPTLDAVASYRKGDNDRFGYSTPANSAHGGYRDRISQSSLALELKVPLYAGGLHSSQVREANQRLAQREDEHEDRRRAVTLQTRSLHRAIHADVEQVQARRQSIYSSQAALQSTHAGRVLGSRNTADVLNAERQLYRAVREYNDARYDYIIDSLKLKQAVGSLASQDLLELSHYLSRDYDPDRDFLPPRPGNLPTIK